MSETNRPRLVFPVFIAGKSTFKVPFILCRVYRHSLDTIQGGQAGGGWSVVWDWAPRSFRLGTGHDSHVPLHRAAYTGSNVRSISFNYMVCNLTLQHSLSSS